MSIKRNEMGHRYYTDKDLEIFQKIKELKKEGLQLKTIKEKLHEKDEIPQVEEHRISGEGITKQQKTEPEFQEEQIQVKIVTPRKFLTEQSFEKRRKAEKKI
ncbi:MAG: helix-turn-helix domain-containing protein [Ruminococcus sp.]